MKVGFFEVDKTEAEYLANQLENLNITFHSAPLTVANLNIVNDYQIISIFTGSKIDRELLSKLPNLKLITTRSTGFDHIDLESARKKNITVCSVPSYGDNTVAEYVFGLLLNLSRKIYLAIDEDINLQGFDLYQKTIGVIGTGKIGREVIKIANGFSMKVLAYDTYPKTNLQGEYKFEYVDFEDLLAKSDVISLHVPLLPSTNHLINIHNYHLIKKGAVLINTSRGAVIDTEVIIKALKEGILSGVGLDVLEGDDEINKDLISHPEVLVTHHNAYNTKEAVQRILDTTIENIKSFIQGKPINVVLEPD